MKNIFGEIITFNTSDGFELNGFLKKSNKKNKKLIIHLHGMGGNFYGGKLTQTILRDLSKKFDVLTVNTRGHGLVNKIRGKNKIMGGTAREKFVDSLHDIDGAIKYGKKLGYKKFILSGHSTGCQKITYFQSKKQNKKVCGIILLSPADDFGLSLLKKDYKKNYTLAKKMIQTGKGNETLKIPKNDYTARRWLSFSDLKNIEAQLFNYKGKLYHFSKIKIPIFASFAEFDVFGKGFDAKKSLELLRMKTNSELLMTQIINNTDHNYKNKENELIKKINTFLELFL